MTQVSHKGNEPDTAVPTKASLKRRATNRATEKRRRKAQQRGRK